MTTMMYAASDKVEVFTLIETPGGGRLTAELPDREAAVDMLKRFTDYGTVAARDLSLHCSALPNDLAAVGSARSTFAEAARLLAVPRSPPNAPPHVAARRPQNLARIVRSMNRATALVSEEGVRLRATRLRR
ncbi:hypothetical protein [Streptomyces mayonensis]|uniref:hypothetical protein n=1 Tax=Streptomyces mayonensis TaxID=2750816 RepID=UPI001C1E589E|nr:hypothetical protein [Streptomyces sp. A108]MBU6529680.1 hypothetical protein [Streptomyces sp. A108]